MRTLILVRLIAVGLSALAGPVAAAERLDTPMVAIPGGSFIMGDANGHPNETPKRVTVNPFAMMTFEVTNRQFAAFVKATRYVTDVERNGEGHVWTDKWRQVREATWKRPHGPGSTLAGKDDHPVLQTSKQDADKFCRYYGMRLPSEAEWEFAARGTDGRRFPWGNERPKQSKFTKGNFGRMRCCALDASDGYAQTSPVGKFPEGASPFGVMDMAGNVWEWTSSAFPGRPNDISIRGGGWGNRAWCLRVSYRHWNPPYIGLDMVGFRCVRDVN